jgi:hypothetical protein
MKLSRLLNIFLVTGPILIISAIGTYFLSNKLIQDNVHQVANMIFLFL